jgi:hypothetical protein
MSSVEGLTSLTTVFIVRRGKRAACGSVRRYYFRAGRSWLRRKGIAFTDCRAAADCRYTACMCNSLRQMNGRSADKVRRYRLRPVEGPCLLAHSSKHCWARFRYSAASVMHSVMFVKHSSKTNVARAGARRAGSLSPSREVDCQRRMPSGY